MGLSSAERISRYGRPLRQHKRRRRINAGATSGNSNKSDNEIQELDVVGNISEEETEEEI